MFKFFFNKNTITKEQMFKIEMTNEIETTNKIKTTRN